MHPSRIRGLPPAGAALALALAACVTTPARPGEEALAAISALEDRRSTGGGQLQAWTRPGQPAAVRERALLALARLQEPATAPAVIAALADPEPGVREWAAFAAGELGLAWTPLPPAVREALAAAVLAAEGAEGTAPARDAELEALGRLRTPPALARLSARLESGSPLAARAARALGVGVKAGGPMPAGGVERLAALTVLPGPEARASRFGAAWALAQAKDPSAVPALAACTRDAAAEVRAVCAKGLGEHGGPGEVEALGRLLLEEDPLAAAEATQEAPDSSPLLRVLLERSFDEVRAPDAAEPETAVALGDPLRRQYLKSRFFVEVETPRGRDLALLDFAEAALLALENALDTLPGDTRPREDELQEVAYVMAVLFRDYVLPKVPSAATVLTERMAAALAVTCRLEAEPSRQLALAVLSALVSFVDEVCGRCAVGCLHRPRAGVGPEFFATTHPAGDGVREVPTAGKRTRRSSRSPRVLPAAPPPPLAPRDR